MEFPTLLSCWVKRENISQQFVFPCFWFWDVESLFTSLGLCMAGKFSWITGIVASPPQAQLPSEHLLLSSFHIHKHFLSTCEIIVHTFWCYKWGNWGGKRVKDLSQIADHAVGRARTLTGFIILNFKNICLYSLHALFTFVGFYMDFFPCFKALIFIWIY